MEPITVHKSIIGLIGITAGGLVFLGLLALLAYFFAGAGVLAGEVLHLVVIGGLLVMAITGGIAWTYWNSTIVMDDTGITVTNWNSLFSYTAAATKWSELEDVDCSQTTIWAQLFGYGTLLVQTAGTQTNLQMSMVASVKKWNSYIYKKLPTSS